MEVHEAMYCILTRTKGCITTVLLVVVCIGKEKYIKRA